ncbi:MAG: hypothetical protein RLZZ230_671 [Candidatus Parcubacteria bacterium]|jgi:hypothetical protein
MNIHWMVIIYTIVLVDSIGAIIMSWFGTQWWMKYTGSIAIHFPPSKGWSVVYFLLVLVIGYLLGVFN